MKPISSSLAKPMSNLVENASSDQMKSTDSEIITKLSKFVYLCFEQRLKYLETRNAD